MFERFKNRNRPQAPAPEEQAPLTIEDRTGLQEKLEAITDKLAVLNEGVDRSFAQKVSGDKHDGAHNVDVDAMTWEIQQLEAQRQELLERIEAINNHLAGVALGSAIDIK